MNIILGADIGGFTLKEAVKEALIKRDYDVFDSTPEAVFFADAAKAVSKGVQSGEFTRGIVFCGTGMGVSIIANKHPGVYAALCESVYQAKRSKVVNNTNVLCLGGMIIGNAMGIEMALAWLEAEHLQGFDEELAQRVYKEFQALEDFEKTVYKE